MLFSMETTEMSYGSSKILVRQFFIEVNRGENMFDQYPKAVNNFVRGLDNISNFDQN